jgi:tetratricopeptide (TPR) repeat protein
MDKYFNLGNYRRTISTSVEMAQTWFNRGLVWCYGFNQEEAARCFEKVIELDPDCAMGYWGIAYAVGPFYNKPWAWYGEQERIQAIAKCHQYAMKAADLSQHASPAEQALIQALVAKHPAQRAKHQAQLDNWTQDYANAMRRACRDFADDLDVICLCAESVMNLTPWKLWDLQHGVPATDACTGEAIEILEHGLDIVDKNRLTPHPGLLHFYIHVYEMSPTPEKALPRADQLRDLCPDSGHLVHMASHIDSLCGHWQNAADANRRAIKVDSDYVELHGTDEFYMISVVHNHDFNIWASMFLGQYQQALESADRICDLVRDKRSIGDEWYLSSTLLATDLRRSDAGKSGCSTDYNHSAGLCQGYRACGTGGPGIRSRLPAAVLRTLFAGACMAHHGQQSEPRHSRGSAGDDEWRSRVPRWQSRTRVPVPARSLRTL